MNSVSFLVPYNEDSELYAYEWLKYMLELCNKLDTFEQYKLVEKVPVSGDQLRVYFKIV